MSCLVFIAIVSRVGSTHDLGVDSGGCSMRSPLVDEQLKLKSVRLKSDMIRRVIAVVARTPPWWTFIRSLTTRLARCCPFSSILRMVGMPRIQVSGHRTAREQEIAARWITEVHPPRVEPEDDFRSCG